MKHSEGLKAAAVEHLSFEEAAARE